ncbi:WD repeat-containing protein [Reticulomyxa filosa]|uniref:WD repeat-containing protein n=1 Tax=Reticulomyxa filosa TaxID=46433 RepID=X6NV16_RETFI|nr:WD repeat-containing protein [Reticulomyxa filosa]|eukprot:ETO29644.1 WD repeat-containing protein [Reticulomyxa filosa]
MKDINLNFELRKEREKGSKKDKSIPFTLYFFKMDQAHFNTLTPLPLPLKHVQCVLYKHEILLCGGWKKNVCYSYHTLKNQYKRICFYPDDVDLMGHCVIKLIDNNNNNDINSITLLSFGGCADCKKHTLIMNYVSVWGDKETQTKIKKAKNYNKWMPLIDKNDKRIYIGNKEDNYDGVRAVIGGSRNHLLFITYCPNNIDVFTLHTFRCINRIFLPIANNNFIQRHCFVLMRKKDNSELKKDKMLLFCGNIGLLIEYDEHKNHFSFHNLWVCTTIRSLIGYTYIYVNDCILFFGGYRSNEKMTDAIHKYSIKDDKWMRFEYILPCSLGNCAGILNEDNTCIHFMSEKEQHTTVEKKRMMIEKEKKDIEEIREEMKKMKLKIDINKLKLDIGSDHFQLKSDGLVNLMLLFLNILWYLIFVFTLNEKYNMSDLIKALDSMVDVSDVKFSKDGTKFVICYRHGVILVLDAKSKQRIQQAKTKYANNYAQFSPDGNKILLYSAKEIVQLMDINSGEIIEIFKSVVERARFSPDGKIIVSCSFDQIIRIWDVQSGQEIKKIEGHLDQILDVEFSFDGKQIVSASNDRTIGIWDVQSGEKLKQLKGHLDSVIRAAFSFDDKFIVSCSADETIRIWDAKSGNQLKRFNRHCAKLNEYSIMFFWKKPNITNVKFFPDGKTVISSLSGIIRLWDVKFGMEIQILEGHTNYITGIDISPDGSTIISSSSDGMVRLWESFWK